MGCDIHMYLEFKDPNPQWVPTGSPWRGWPRVNPGRDYELFGYLAGVRSSADPVVEPRGIPDDIAWETANDWFLRINDEYAARDDMSGYCTLAKAQEWSAYGHKIINDDQGNPYRVEHPDWHTPTWLTLDEYTQALAKIKPEPYQMGYWALLGAMKELAWYHMDTRLVFWFDN
jgi:hypothetical protein